VRSREKKKKKKKSWADFAEDSFEVLLGDLSADASDVHHHALRNRLFHIGGFGNFLHDGALIGGVRARNCFWLFLAHLVGGAGLGRVVGEGVALARMRLLRVGCRHRRVGAALTLHLRRVKTRVIRRIRCKKQTKEEEEKKKKKKKKKNLLDRKQVVAVAEQHQQRLVGSEKDPSTPNKKTSSNT
jgi:hypothetical protein